MTQRTAEVATAVATEVYSVLLLSTGTSEASTRTANSSRRQQCAQ
jgi:hypothetical protein